MEQYFENARGIGVLSTADASGSVNAAIYSRPHVTGPDEVAFIMADRLTHANLQSNPSAVYLFKEDGGYEGKRLYLTKIHEEKDSPLIEKIRRGKHASRTAEDQEASKFLVYFKVDRVLPLIGDGR